MVCPSDQLSAHFELQDDNRQPRIAFVSAEAEQPPVQICNSLNTLLPGEDTVSYVLLAHSDSDEAGVMENDSGSFSVMLSHPLLPSSVMEAVQDVLGHVVYRDAGRAAGATEEEQDAVAVLHGARILLVEDNQMNKELATVLLEDAGMRVTTAVNGQQALNILRTETFDGVLMDCQMPVMDGYTATALIRKQGLNKTVPIIALTANAMQEDREKVLEVGMNDHIGKPIDVKELYATMAKWISPATSVVADSSANADTSVLEQVAKAENESAHDSIFDGLQAIDADAARKGCLGKPDLYARQLRRFISEWSKLRRLYAEAEQDSNADAVTRLFHSLKSNAGQIGALQLQAEAGALEQHAKSHTTVDATQLKDLYVSVASLIEAIERVLAERLTPKESTDEVSPLEPAELPNRLQAIRSLLADHNPAVIRELETLGKAIKGLPQAEDIGAIHSVSMDYDFDTAKRMLEALLATLDDSVAVSS